MLILIILFLLIFYNFYWKRRNFPPGPIPIPILGNCLEVFVKEPGYQAFIDWHRKFGPMYTFWLGETPIIIIADYNLMKETFIKDADSYIGRPLFKEPASPNYGGRYGILFTEGDFWRNQRHFVLQSLRNFGLGKNLMQERIIDEVSSLIEKVQVDISNGIKKHKIDSYIDIAIGSIINNILFSYRFEGEKLQEFYEIKRMASDLIKTLGNPFVQALRNHMEKTKYIPILNKYYYDLVNSKQVLSAFYKKQLEEHEKRIDHDSEPTDLVEAFLKKKTKQETEGSNDSRFYTMTQLLNLCSDLWLAGQETTSNTLSWGILYLMQEREIQTKMQEELGLVIGSDRIISMDDKPNLHYTSAVINEIQRIANLIPINVLHTTSRNVNINGHYIRKGTMIIPQICAILYDEKVFPNPHQFDPTRFLDDKWCFKKVDELIPFSIGKRICLGEGLARMELFLFIANIFNQFKIKPILSQMPSMKRKIGGTIAPQPFVCHIENRY